MKFRIGFNYALIGMLILAASGCSGASNEQKNKAPSADVKDRPWTSTLPASVITAWKNAGAKVGWSSRNEHGYDAHEFAAPPHEKEVITAFLLEMETPSLKDLPEPDAEFVLVLRNTVRVDFNEIARFKRLRGISFNRTKLTGAGLKHLSGLKELRMLATSETQLSDEGMSEVGQLKALQKLAVTNAPVTDTGVERISGLSNLEELEWHETKVTDRGLKAIAQLENLQILNMFANDLHGIGIMELGKLKRLTSLRISGKFTPKVMKELATLAHLQILSVSSVLPVAEGLNELVSLKHLRDLSIHNTNVTDRDLTRLDGLKLESLRIPAAAETDLGLKHYIPLLKAPNKISLHDWKITDAGLKELAAVPNLEYLYLRKTEVTDAGLKELQVLTKLKSLDLSHTRITDNGISHLANLPLQELRLDRTAISDEGLGDVTHLTELKLLWLNETQVSDDGLKSLMKLKKLEKLELWKTRATDAGVQRLQSALPKTKIDR